MLTVILEEMVQIKVALAQLIKIDIITRSVQAKNVSISKLQGG